MKDLQDLVISQMLSVFHPKGNAMEYWCPWSTSLLTPSALLELEYNCQVTEAAMYNHMGSLPLEEMQSSVLISFLVWLSKRKKKSWVSFLVFSQSLWIFCFLHFFHPAWGWRAWCCLIMDTLDSAGHVSGGEVRQEKGSAEECWSTMAMAEPTRPNHTS